VLSTDSTTGGALAIDAGAAARTSGTRAAAVGGAFPENPWWIVVAAFIAVLVANGPVLTFSFGVFMQSLVDELGIGRGTLGGFFFLQAVLGALTAPLFGALVDRYGTRPVMIPWIVGFAALLMLMAATGGSLAAFIAVFLLLGPGSQGQGPIGYAKALTQRFGDRLGLALGISAAGVGVGAALLPQFARVLIEHFGWRDAYIGLGLAELVIALPMVAIFVRGVGGRTTGPASEAAKLAGFSTKEAVRSRQFWLLAAVIFLSGTVMTGLSVSIVPLLTDRGFSLADASYVASTIGVSLILGRVLAGFLLDRVFGPHVAIAFFLMPAIAIALFNAMGAAWVPFACAVLIGVASGAEIDIVGYLTRRYFGERSYGQLYGWYFALFFAGNGLGPFLMGTSFQALGTYLVAEIGFAAALFVACGLIFRLGPYRRFSPQHGTAPASRPTSVDS
jgi:MFS family permease